MSEEPTVRLDTDGKPIGFIDHPDDYKTVTYEVIEHGIGRLIWMDSFGSD